MHIPLHVGAPGNGNLSLFGTVSASMRLRVRERCLVFVSPTMMCVWCKLSRLSDGNKALGVSGKSLYLIWVLRFRGGWGGGEVSRDLSVPLSPKSTLQSDRGVPWAPSPLLNRQFLGLFVAVRCCLVCPRNTRRCSDPCCLTRNRPVCINVFFGVRSSSSLVPSLS